MVAKEAHTSSSVKDLIVAATGVDDADWEGTFNKPTGGILTVRSELGEPIHKVARRGVKLWKEFEDTVFNLPKEKRVTWLAEHRGEVIKKLNADFAKPWFRWKKGGSVAEDLGDMTYEEVTLRMVRLMFVTQEGRWIDLSLRNLTGDWLRRVEERFAGVNSGGAKASMLQSFTSLNEPHAFVSEFFVKYPASTTQFLASEDKAYFLAISQRCGQKPAPFIAILDTDFEIWFKKVCSHCVSGLPFLHIWYFRILFGKPKTSRLFRSKIYSATSIHHSSTSLCSASMATILARFQPLTICVRNPEQCPSCLA
jgi:fatty acid synthase subunit alpha